MNESLRWKLVLGCLMIAALEAPHAFLLLVEDFTGPYRSSIEEGSSAARNGADLDTSLELSFDPSTDSSTDPSREIDLALAAVELNGDSDARR